MYEPTYWKDEVVENPYRYKETQNSDGSIEHVPDPGEVLQEGTEQSATNFNHMEQGILEAHEISAEAVRMLKSVMRKVEGLDGEKVTVTLTNSQVYPFNNSVKTIQLKTPRNYKTYLITREYTEVEKENPNYDPENEEGTEQPTIKELKPVPFSMDRCELRLWEREV